jgi:carbon storage regulator
MLVISRKVGEKVRIGNAWLTVLDIDGRGNVRLGVTAPRDVPVHRAEVVERMEESARLKAQTFNLP